MLESILAWLHFGRPSSPAVNASRIFTIVLACTMSFSLLLHGTALFGGFGLFSPETGSNVFGQHTATTRPAIQRTATEPVFPSLSSGAATRKTVEFPFSAEYRASQASWQTTRPGTYFSLALSQSGTGGGSASTANEPDAAVENFYRGEESTSASAGSSGTTSMLPTTASILHFGLAWRGKKSEKEKNMLYRHHTVSAPYSEVQFRWTKHNGANYGEQVIFDTALQLEFKIRFVSGVSNRNQGQPSFRVVVDVWDISADGGVAAGKKSSTSKKSKNSAAGALSDVFFYWYSTTGDGQTTNETVAFHVKKGDDRDADDKKTESAAPLPATERADDEVFALSAEGTGGNDSTKVPQSVFSVTSAEANKQKEVCAIQSGDDTKATKSLYFDFPNVWKDCKKRKKAEQKRNGGKQPDAKDQLEDGLSASWIALRIPLNFSANTTSSGAGGEKNYPRQSFEIQSETGTSTSDATSVSSGGVQQLSTEKLLAAEEEKFSTKVANTFGKRAAAETSTSRSKNQHTLESAVASLLGGIGQFAGNLLLKDAEGKKYRTKDIFHLKTGTPARAMFPRGFLWDEGFHLLVFLEWDVELFYEIVFSWFSLQDPKSGWIPREIPLGKESESFVPEQFLGQEYGVMNPPTLLLGVLRLLQKFKREKTILKGETLNGHPPEPEQKKKDEAKSELPFTQKQFILFLRRITPHIAKWLEQWHLTQENVSKIPRNQQLPNDGEASLTNVLQYLLTTNPFSLVKDTRVMEKTFKIDEFTCYRWKDRKDEKHVLSSGLDDYPRGMFVNKNDECHLDNHLWFMVLVYSMREICGLLSATADAVTGHVQIQVAEDAAPDGRNSWQSFCPRNNRVSGVARSPSASRTADDVVIAPGGPLDYDLMLQYLRSALKNNHFDEKSHLFADFVGKQPHDKKNRPITTPPWLNGNGQCNPRAGVECPVGECCSPSGWCGASPDYCNCPQCVKYEKPLEKRKEYKDNLKKIHSPHFGYVNLLPFMFPEVVFGGEADDSSGINEEHQSSALSSPFSRQMIEKTSGAVGKKVKAELVTKYGIRSLAKSDALAGKGENYWRGKIWANLNLLTILKSSSFSSKEPGEEQANTTRPSTSTRSHFDLFNSDGKSPDAGATLRTNFLKNIERNFEKSGNFHENYDPITGEGTGAIPFTGWTAVAYVLLQDPEHYTGNKGLIATTGQQTAGGRVTGSVATARKDGRVKKTSSGQGQEEEL
ncbi:unnamed protein product [Amoebophrya sp. A120]|nr:unnamed protein product [Amoebophrya sp. A120]|eukprot:GSA120T00010689001.1